MKPAATDLMNLNDVYKEVIKRAHDSGDKGLESAVRVLVEDNINLRKSIAKTNMKLHAVSSTKIEILKSRNLI